MNFDPDNSIVKLCAQGMELEGNGETEEAHKLFLLAWQEAANDFEKFISAHYIARHQKTVADKLKWDKIALQAALKIEDETMQANYPSLYLNIAKCYEDLGDFDKAKENYQLALLSSNKLPDDGYGNMIISGIKKGIERMSQW
ncbi:tetratricopeptide repeat protein [Ferruginibacter paludis]|uniref:tetratricopeptide repeat protein n=1 Tax=Ferruginibacter paludis TaxID=1310417 RepID=UPI0025B4CA50|nr:tetratricopeptide repeat protein [Ferruginibacter paludis]MDN3657440.1 tetratricopeptide repeat protein [Ferruginibacter paludis]